MFSRSKGEKGKPKPAEKNRDRSNLAQFGLLDMPPMSDLGLATGQEDENDADLEAELLALMGGSDSSNIGQKKGKKLVSGNALDKMVAECMKDDDDDEMVDDDDPQLLAELSALASDDETEDMEELPEEGSKQRDLPQPKNAPVIVKPSPFVAGHSVTSLLKERIEMYKEAERNALAADESSRAKRFSRGLRNLNHMLRDAEQGKPIKEEDIPPVVLLSSRNNSAMDLSDQNSSSAISKPSLVSPNQDFPTLSPVPSNQSYSDSGSTGSSVTRPSSLNQGNSSRPSTIQHDIVFRENQSSGSHLAGQAEIPSSTSNESPGLSNTISSSQSSTHLDVIKKRQLEYKMAAIKAKQAGDKDQAIRLMKVMKQMDPLVEAASNNQPIDLNTLPPNPSQLSIGSSQSSTNLNRPEPEIPHSKSMGELPDAGRDPSGTSASSNTGPSAPASIPEALEQRMAKYKEQMDKAKADGNARKERMNQRIIKQYQDALKSVKMGRAVDFSELPTPPGFPPLPSVGSASSPLSEPSTPSSAQSGHLGQPQTASQDNQPKPKPVAAVKPLAPAPPPPAKSNVRKAPQSRVERQMSMLTRRQTQFKIAALEAKKRGEIEQAKEFLRNAKGIDQLIGATNSGLPVDMNTPHRDYRSQGNVPIPPQEKIAHNPSLDFEVVEKDDCVYSPPSTDAEAAVTYSKLEEDLIAQIKMCAHTREHFKAIGDVASSNRFEQLILHTKKDLDAVRVAFKRGDRPPRFHYESRTFTMIRCNTDLNDSDCEVTVMRGINFNVSNPSENDSYVKIEFPYPTETPPQEKTTVVKGTNNPEFNHKVVFSIDRKLRSTPRIFKRHAVKMQIVTKGGWFHRDSVLGQVKVPLADLENKCTLHESFDITDERKKLIGGKLEIKIRIRNPILSKQLEKVTEKWIVIDGF